MITLSENVKKYGVRLDWLSGAVADAGIQPKGMKKGLRKPANVYDEKEIVDLLIGTYNKRFLRHKKLAEHWKLKATETMGIYRKDHPLPPDVDDD